MRSFVASCLSKFRVSGGSSGWHTPYKVVLNLLSVQFPKGSTDKALQTCLNNICFQTFTWFYYFELGLWMDWETPSYYPIEIQGKQSVLKNMTDSSDQFLQSHSSEKSNMGARRLQEQSADLKVKEKESRLVLSKVVLVLFGVLILYGLWRYLRPAV